MRTRSLAIVCLFLTLTVGCEFHEGGSEEGAVPSEAEAPNAVIVSEPTPEPLPPPPPPSEATLVAVGDIMMHTPQLPGAYVAETGSYDFSGFFQRVKPTIAAADWAMANLETPLAGNERGYKGYPRFNAPVEMADALSEAGFDIVSIANNHILDQGEAGAIATIRTLQDRGLKPIGTSEEGASPLQEAVITKKNGIAAAFLAYTYGTNGIPLPQNAPYLVYLVNEKQIAEDIAHAKARGADVIVVSLHFGNEYQRHPTDAQRNLAAAVIQSGADIIVGHHPHVVQPYERITTATEQGTREGFVIYSLGNFISNQFGDYKEYGAMLKVTIRKSYSPDGTSSIELAETEAIPTWVHKYRESGKSKYRILPVEAVAAAADDPLIANRMFPVLKEQAQELNRHLRSMTEAGDRAEP